jgi:hypothetical protein
MATERGDRSHGTWRSRARAGIVAASERGHEMLLLAWATGCGTLGQTCKTEGPSEEWCPIDPCALECDSLRSGVGCCVDTHGYGLDGHDLEVLEATCSEDECDDSRYISAAAALCIAQVNGLGSGVGWCGATLTSLTTELSWLAANTVYDGCEVGSPNWERDVVFVDARTGEAGPVSTLYEDLMECPAE